jgi:hypothetical protein
VGVSENDQNTIKNKIEDLPIDNYYLALIPRSLEFDETVRKEWCLTIQVGITSNNCKHLLDLDVSGFAQKTVPVNFNYYENKINYFHSDSFMEFIFSEKLEEHEENFFCEFVKNFFDKALLPE